MIGIRIVISDVTVLLAAVQLAGEIPYLADQAANKADIAVTGCAVFGPRRDVALINAVINDNPSW